MDTLCDGKTFEKLWRKVLEVSKIDVPLQRF